MDSILNSVKAYLGISEDDEAFDTDILMAINAVMTVLYQMGIGPADAPFVVTNTLQTWRSLLGSDPIGGVREFVCMRVRLLFDPPTNTYVVQALNDQADEFEWRLIAEADKKAYEEVAD